MCFPVADVFIPLHVLCVCVCVVACLHVAAFSVHAFHRRRIHVYEFALFVTRLRVLMFAFSCIFTRQRVHAFCVCNYIRSCVFTCSRLRVWLRVGVFVFVHVLVARLVFALLRVYMLKHLMRERV